jgi:hypothetical protein
MILSYDLNGSRPSHQEMDEFLNNLVSTRGRVLETVWWVEWSGTALQLCERVRTILGPEDLLLVVEASDAAWTKLLIDTASLKSAWRKAA